MSSFNITSEELAEALDVTVDKLYEICDIFDEDPNDAWELVEDVHFKWGPFSSRIFSPEGAVEICNYLEENQQERPLLKRWKRWVLQRDRKLKGLMIAKRIQEISSLGDGQIKFYESRAFLSPKACRGLLGLGNRQDVLRRTFEQIQRSENVEIEVLEKGVDFIEDDQDARFFSRSGIASVGKHLSVKLTQKHRQEWVKVVADYAPRALYSIEQYEKDKAKEIEKAKNYVRSKARGKCQITDRKQSVHKFNLEVHHLFDQTSYPKLAAVEANLIAIGSDIHKHFHQWMGGTHVTCTVEDMERYISEFSNALFKGDDGVDQATKVARKLLEVKMLLKTHL